MDKEEKSRLIEAMGKSDVLPVINHYGGKAFLPVLIFVILYVGSGILLDLQGVEQPFRQVPRTAAAFLALLAAFIMGRESFEQKSMIFSKASGDTGVMMMCFIFMFAGAFAGVSKAMGGVDSTVNLGLSIIPVQFVIAGIFMIACFVALSLGTSVGTVATVGPIAVSMAEAAGLSMPLTIGAVVGGAMFGDNLSIISDTTIAACRGQGADMRGKFIMNFKIAIPAALICIGVYVVTGEPAILKGPFPYDIVKVLPYLAVLVMALLGLDVMLVLFAGTVLSGLVGFGTGALDWLTFTKAVGSGMGGMMELVAISLILKGLSGFAAVNGGLVWLKSLFDRRITTRKGAEFAIAGIVSFSDITMGNNTVAIIVANPIAKELAEKFRISPRRAASILDIYTCTVHAFLPYSGQSLLACTLTGLSPLVIMGSLYYQMILGVAGLLAIYFAFPSEKKKNDESEMTA